MFYKSSSGLCFLAALGHQEIYCPRSRKAWNTGVLKNNHFFKMISFLCEYRSEEDLVKYISKLDSLISLESIKKTLDTLVKEQLIVVSEDKINHDGKWNRFGWYDPFIFHLHTHFYPKHDYNEDPRDEQDTALMRSYVEAEASPPIYKTFNESLVIKLSNKNNCFNYSINDAFALKKFKKKSVPYTFDQFSRLCFLAFGETGAKKFKATGRFINKTIPSGGSRHPTEAYVIVLEVEGITSGLYHYNVKDHALELLVEGDLSHFCSKHILYPKDRIWFSPHFLFLYTTIFERSMFRYREPRSYRVMHYDLGHIMQNIKLLVSSSGGQLYSGYSLHEKDVEKLLGIDGIMESIMGYTAIG